MWPSRCRICQCWHGSRRRAKVIHIGEETSSNVLMKSLSQKEGGLSTYRGLLDIQPGAHNSVSRIDCDALILDSDSKNDTILIFESVIVLQSVPMRRVLVVSVKSRCIIWGRDESQKMRRKRWLLMGLFLRLWKSSRLNTLQNSMLW